MRSRMNVKEHVTAGGPRGVPRRLAFRAANAATHGLTARRYLPEILGADLIERHRQGFRSEWKPATPTQAFLVEELARHAAALERATPIEEAVLRTSARGLSAISDSDGDEDFGDHALAAACGAETVDRVTRYRRAHEKAFVQALARLRELRAVSNVDLVPPAIPPLRFEETACVDYLRKHHDAGKSRCPSCGGTHGKWLVGRELWQCRKCRRQFSAGGGRSWNGPGCRFGCGSQRSRRSSRIGRSRRNRSVRSPGSAAQNGPNTRPTDL